VKVGWQVRTACAVCLLRSGLPACGRAAGRCRLQLLQQSLEAHSGHTLLGAVPDTVAALVAYLQVPHHAQQYASSQPLSPLVTARTAAAGSPPEEPLARLGASLMDCVLPLLFNQLLESGLGATGSRDCGDGVAGGGTSNLLSTQGLMAHAIKPVLKVACK
jgi:hypothetical protein